eukprot:TRINITY_DN13704_c0_g1_i3.p1 TRINITY_DN13704_c0_g1~~TRINITY_DN13704_c0_g1_i3.p1  ORF type:complete len:320 (-),score=58.47 TRINITY_DN13704_c0_g1_i3:137-1096(-)
MASASNASNAPDPELLHGVFGNTSLLLEVAPKLRIEALLRASESCVCWCEAARDEDLWQERCHRDFHLSMLPEGCASWRAVYADHATSRFEFRGPAGDGHDCLFKTLLIGDSGVGKSSFQERFVNDRYGHRYAGVGADFKIKYGRCKNQTVKLQMWDTAGQERFRDFLGGAFYRGTHCILVMYDVTDRKSFEGCDFWLEQAREQTPEHCVVGLVACKCDQADQLLRGPPRQVGCLEGAALAARWSAEAPEPRGPWSFVHFSETSAKDDVGIERVMVRAVRSMLAVAAVVDEAKEAQVKVAQGVRSSMIESEQTHRCVLC